MTPSNQTEAFRKKRIPKRFTLHSSLLTLMIVSSLTIISGCSDKDEKKSLTEGGMKCGAGKCGASMANGSALLVKKKMNILNQLSQDDPRRDCVLKAGTTKTLYACVRDKTTGRLTSKYTTEQNKSEKRTNKKSLSKDNSKMKCESGKCSNGK